MTNKLLTIRKCISRHVSVAYLIITNLHIAETVLLYDTTPTVPHNFNRDSSTIFSITFPVTTLQEKVNSPFGNRTMLVS